MTGIYTVISLIIPTCYFGTFDLLGLTRFKHAIKDTIKYSPKAYGEIRSKLEAHRLDKYFKGRPEYSEQDMFANRLQETMKQPADLESAKSTLNDYFEHQQPLVAILSHINYNPKEVQARQELAKKFNEIQLSNWLRELTQDYRLKDKKSELEAIRQNFKNVDFQIAKKDIISTIRDALQDKKDLRYVDINGIVMYDPNFVLVGLPHFNPEQEIDIVFNQPIKDFVKDLKKQYYTISYDVKLALIKGDKIIYIDENSNQHMTRWLIGNGYSKDETVYIIPVDKDYNGPLYEEEYWKGTGNPSPYTSHFSKFREKLQDLLYGPHLISRNTKTATNKFFFPDTHSINYEYLRNTASEMKIGRQFNIEDTMLLRMQARFLNKLEEHYKEGQMTEREYIEHTGEVNDLFNKQYAIYGYIVANPFYFEGRLNAFKIGDILMDYKIITKNSLEGSLYEFIKPFGGSRSALTMENYKKENPSRHLSKYSIPREGIYDKLKQSFYDAVMDYANKHSEITDEIAEKVVDKIDALINNFIQVIKETETARNLFKGYSNSNSRVDLLMRIQNCHPALRRVSSLEKLSTLLFDDENFIKYRFLGSGEIISRPDPTTLYKIAFRALKWTVLDFDGLVSGLVSESDLEAIGNNVENVIYKWMLRNPTDPSSPNPWSSYFTETPRRFGRLQPKSFLKLEHELKQSLVHAVSAFTEKDISSIKKLANALKMSLPSLEKLLSQGSTSTSVKDLLRAKTTIVSYILDASMTEEKLRFYDRALAKIDEYLATRHLRLFEEKIVSKKGYDKSLWHDDRILAYHVISLLCRDLGFDPLTFRPLSPQIFDRNSATGLFARHHLDTLKKFSVYLQHLLLTDSSTHRTYDSHIDLEDQKILVKIINDLIQNDGSGPNKEITANDVEKAFLDNFGDPKKVKFYLDNYWDWQTPNFQKNLKDFNDRKKLIKNGKYEEFIKNEYNDAYRRFFGDAMGILNSLTELSDFKGYRLSRVFSIADIDYLKRVFSI